MPPSTASGDPAMSTTPSHIDRIRPHLPGTYRGILAEEQRSRLAGIFRELEESVVVDGDTGLTLSVDTRRCGRVKREIENYRSLKYGGG